MKKCTNENCSAINPDDANFCRICGRKFDDRGAGITEKPNRSFSEPTKTVRGIKFVRIKGGTFMMGSPESEPGHRASEKQHKETVSDFYMSEKTITNEQFCVFMNENDVYGNGEMDVKDFGNKILISYNEELEYENSLWITKSGKENHPIVYVSWFGAKVYCEWLGGRLHTSAEWEYACRAGTRTAFNTGKNLTTSQANYDGNYPYDGNAPGKNLRRTQPVGSYTPNAWGLYDMHGNVYEWCLDEYLESGTSSPRYRYIRGGGCTSYADNCRSAFCKYCNPDDAAFEIGFRVLIPIV